MTQVLNVPIQIPDDFILVDREQYEDLTTATLIGKAWEMKDLRAWLGNKSVDWIKENILYNPRFKTELDQMKRDGLIKEATGKGSPWRFKVKEMAEFLDKHYAEMEW